MASSPSSLVALGLLVDSSLQAGAGRPPGALCLWGLTRSVDDCAGLGALCLTVPSSPWGLLPRDGGALLRSPSQGPLGQLQLLGLSFSCSVVTSQTAARQASLSSTISQSLCKLMLVMPSSHLILSPFSSPTLNLSQHHGLFQ